MPSSSTPQHNPTAAAIHGGRRRRCWFSWWLMLPRESFSSKDVNEASPPPGRNSNHLCVHAALPRLAIDRCTPLSAIIPVFSNWPHVANFGLAKILQREASDRSAGTGAMSRVAKSYEYIASGAKSELVHD